MSDQAVLYEVEDRVATITLNRPENRNSMTPDVLSGLSDAMSRVQQDPEVRCVVITGTGKSFCAGADFKSGLPLGDNEEEGQYMAPQERTYRMYGHFLSILDVEVPTIAAMQGHAIGGGLGLAVVCDLRIANEEARYGANFVRLGLHPGMATTYLLPRLMGVTRGIEFLLTGRIVSGAESTWSAGPRLNTRSTISVTSDAFGSSPSIAPSTASAGTPSAAARFCSEPSRSSCSSVLNDAASSDSP